LLETYLLAETMAADADDC